MLRKERNVGSIGLGSFVKANNVNFKLCRETVCTQKVIFWAGVIHSFFLIFKQPG
jgi:hypothetical protein